MEEQDGVKVTGGAVKQAVEVVTVVVLGLQTGVEDVEPEVLDEVLEQGGHVDGVTVDGVAVEQVKGGHVDGVTVVEHEPDDVTVEMVLNVDTLVVVVVKGGGQVDGVTVVEQEPDVIVEIVL
jgi:hypothetical protein